MVNILIGAITVVALWLVVEFTRKQGLGITWWQWLLTALGLAFAAFTVAAIATFISEGALKGALVVGGILVLITVIWGVLMGRYVFLKPSR